jgi:glycosyltransferase involved in cell wall biosynthesis
MSGNPVKISIIVPVHNAGLFLRDCLDSVVNQTLPDIEVFCVDDASTDGSAGILEEYARRDPRVRLIRYPENRSASQARKDGALAAQGEYVMFLDADDRLELNACEELYGHITRQGVDILHFSTKVTSVGQAPGSRVSAIEGFTRPHAGRLEGRAVFEACFREGKYGYTLWNKVFSAALCRRAFAHVSDGRFPKAQDLYAYFVLAFFANSYFGLETAVYHHYRFGSGITGRTEIDLDQFATYCTQNLVSRAIRQFLVAQGEWNRYQAEHDKLHRNLLGDCVWNWQAHLSPADQPRGFDILVAQWGAADAIAGLAKRSWEQRAEVARAIRGAQAIASRKKAVRTIGTYYHWISTGGIQRVIASLIPLWQEFGCEVVLFTDTPPGGDDYELPPGVRRVVLPSWRETNADNFHLRAAEWQRTLAEEHVDVMIYHAWASKVLLWDLLAVKCGGVPFVVNAHSVFSLYLTTLDTYFAEMPAVYALCDAVVALSRVDRRFWSHFVPRAFFLPNPLTFDLNGLACAKLAGRELLWVGRFSREKQPVDAVRIMAHVVRAVPSARLRMVGAGSDEVVNDQVRGEIEAHGLQDQVVLCGYQKEVGAFYESASIYLSTSRYEGFPMGLAESKSYGLPCVMYALPFLELVRDGEGLVAVAPGDIAAAAKEIVALLQDDGRRAHLGRAARDSIQKYADFNLAAGWRAVLESVAEPAVPSSIHGAEEQAVDDTARIMMETFFVHFNQGRNYATAWRQKAERLGARCEKMKLRLEEKRMALKKAQARERALQQTWTWKIGWSLLLLPRLVLSMLRRCRSGPGSRRLASAEQTGPTAGVPR